MSTIDRMRERLALLAPEHLQIDDDSGKHIGHEGAKGGGGHYSIRIVSRQFTGQAKLACHRMVYDALGDLMQREIHALAIDACPPDRG
jgi:BolA family transcriptional regulator, general stress-responsive regulator